MASEENKHMITEFANITGVDSMRAEFYLESSGWQLQVALGSFYEEDDTSMDVVDESAATQRPQPDIVDATPPVSNPTTSRPKSNRVVTVNDMKKNQNTDDEDEGQRFYAGGSDHSGQQVVGPKKKKTSEIVDNLFKKAKEHGAEEVSAGSNPIMASKPRNFAGVGYRLGDTEDKPSQTVHGQKLKKEEKEMHCKVKLWKNGFTINDEELRDYKDKKNATFLGSISKGEIPHELLQQARGGEVHLDMEDHREEEYTAPKPKVKAFSGVGNLLGSPAPNVIATASSAASSSSGSVGQQAIQVDTSQPHTSIQLRLADGSRLVGKFNNTHTLGNIRNFIVASRPQYAGQNFALMTTFPNKEYRVDNETIEDAKLQNAVLVQRLR
ncbi:NSFL1 cofactor p47-like [Antedon mediterranea]|uniref:NSFL1 cofactor p47-like n=1 Tax=Antedon mediterranea TaxID=105859 RepID=UPI003AF5D5C4